MKMKPNLTVTKSNALIKASYRLTLTEMRILLYGISKLNPTWKEMPLTHKVGVKDMAEFYELNPDGFYSELKTALCDKLFMRKIVTHLDEDNSTLERWIYKVDYHKPTQTFSYTFNPSLKEHLIDLKNRFTNYKLTEIAKMNSIYSIRLYELSISRLNSTQKDAATFHETIEDLKIKWGLSKKYSQYADFKKYTIETAIPEINKYTDIKVRYEEVKDGRAVAKLIFHVKRNTKHKTELAPADLPVLENNREEPKPQPNSAELPDFSQEEQPPMSDSIEYNQENYTPQKQATMEDKPMTTTYHAERTPTPTTLGSKSNKSSNSFSEFNNPKRQNEELQTTELRDDEIDDCSDVLRLKFTMMNLDKLIQSFSKSEGEAQMKIVNMSQLTKNKTSERLKELYAQGAANIIGFWEHDGKKTI